MSLITQKKIWVRDNPRSIEVLLQFLQMKGYEIYEITDDDQPQADADLIIFNVDTHDQWSELEELARQNLHIPIIVISTNINMIGMQPLRIAVIAIVQKPYGDFSELDQAISLILS